MWLKAIEGIAIPFIGTALGSACVFFMKKQLSRTVQRALTGFAGGVMVAASIWSLLIPAMSQCADKGRWAFLPAFIGFWLGILFLLLLDKIIPHLHMNAEQAEGPKSKAKKTTMISNCVTTAFISACGLQIARRSANTSNFHPTAARKRTPRQSRRLQPLYYDRERHDDRQIRRRTRDKIQRFRRLYE